MFKIEKVIKPKIFVRNEVKLSAFDNLFHLYPYAPFNREDEAGTDKNLFNAL